MSEEVKESTNGGSKVKFVGGQTIVDPEQNDLVVPPDASQEATCSDRDEDYITMKLIGQEQERKEGPEK